MIKENEKNFPVPIDELEKKIIEFVSIEDFKTGKDQLETLKIYAKKRGVERSLIQRIHAGSIRCAWEIGGILKEIISRGRPSDEEKNTKVRLEDLGISKTSSHRYQIINNIPKELLNERIDKMMRDDVDITEKEFYKFAKSLEETHEDEDLEDGSSRENDIVEARDKFAYMTKEGISELRNKGIIGIDCLTDVELELIARGIIEIVMNGPGKIKNKIERFVEENSLTVENYWVGLRYVIRQMNSVIMSLDLNTNPASPKAFLYFIRNLKSMLGLIKTWKPEALEKCPVCEGKKEIPNPNEKEKNIFISCDFCLDGYVGWFKK